MKSKIAMCAVSFFLGAISFAGVYFFVYENLYYSDQMLIDQNLELAIDACGAGKISEVTVEGYVCK